MFFLELECQNARCLYKHPHLEQKQKYMKRKIKNLITLGLIETLDLSHFVKEKIFLTPMEPILIIPEELEYLKGLVKLAKKKKDAQAA
jgi:hypothetical protein